MRSKEQRLKNWEVIWIITMILWLISMIYFMTYYTKDSRLGEVKDNWWHIGYADCERNYNLTSDEMMILNKYRIEVAIEKQRSEATK
jgi:hypothetical protein